MPEPLVSLVEQGVIEEVVRPLMSGKEAQVYLVVAQGVQHVAKIYKEASERTFKHRSAYAEGRRVRNSRDQRAMAKRTNYGRAQDEAAWRATEVDVIYRLRDAGVRVPEPKAYVDDVLVMELVTDQLGNPAPRLADVPLDRRRADEMFEALLREVVKMLCAGLVHGDLSEFNILAGSEGTVIIDFPQAIDSATNLNARKFLIRDVGNLKRFFGRHRRDLQNARYAEEMWDLYERGELKPDSILTGRFKRKAEKADVSSLLEDIEAMERESRARREALGLPPSRPARQPRPAIAEEPPRSNEPPAGRRRRRGRRKPGSGPVAHDPNARRGQQRDAALRTSKPSGRGGVTERGGKANRNAAPADRAQSPRQESRGNEPTGPNKPRRRRRSRRRPGGASGPRR